MLCGISCNVKFWTSNNDFLSLCPLWTIKIYSKIEGTPDLLVKCQDLLASHCAVVNKMKTNLVFLYHVLGQGSEVVLAILWCSAQISCKIRTFVEGSTKAFFKTVFLLGYLQPTETLWPCYSISQNYDLKIGYYYRFIIIIEEVGHQV